MNNFPKMHVSLYVSDISKTVAFYKTFFDQEPSKVKSDYAKFMLDSPALIISFVENTEKVQANFGHLGIQVETEQELAIKLLKAKQNNITVLEEIGTNCCYATQDKFWVADPDGHQWEIYYFHEDSEFNDPKYANESATACCTPKTKMTINEVVEQNACCEPGSDCC
ncbi:MAG: VOC family protein [Flavobacteriales bacterium]|nr:VOC family protein [Flavobacteriales bacterium]